MPETSRHPLSPIHTRACIVGGGPAGMMLGYLLARAGVDVVVLEKHADFFRDFRGDTIHPSTLELMHELGLIDDFLALPHEKADRLVGRVYGETVTMADFTHLPVHCKYLLLMPQWDFLDFLARKATRYPRFRLLRSAVVTDLVEDGERIVGVGADTPQGRLEVRADLVVGCDGRHTTVRERAGLETQKIGAPIDVLWFRVPRDAGTEEPTGGFIQPGSFFVTLNRGSYWQCGHVIPKGSLETLRAGGIEAWRDGLAQLAPSLAAGLKTVVSWDDVKLLTVEIDRMPRWYREGLLCIGDAAHAMSPVGGVGINLAIQDAVAASNLLTEALLGTRLSVDDLERVQQRREWPARVTQRMQVAVQDEVISAVLSGQRPLAEGLPLPLRMFQRFALLQRLPARLVGLGVRPEHVRTKEAA